jgi:hypothetical protein
MASISSIIVELTRDISKLCLIEVMIHKPKNTLAGASCNISHNQRVSGGKCNRAHAFRGSKKVNHLISIPGRCRLEGTSSQFSCGEYRTLCYGSLMDPMETAIRRHCLAIGFLK